MAIHFATNTSGYIESGSSELSKLMSRGLPFDESNMRWEFDDSSLELKLFWNDKLDYAEFFDSIEEFKEELNQYIEETSGC